MKIRWKKAVATLLAAIMILETSQFNVWASELDTDVDLAQEATTEASVITDEADTEQDSTEDQENVTEEDAADEVVIDSPTEDKEPSSQDDKSEEVVIESEEDSENEAAAQSEDDLDLADENASPASDFNYSITDGEVTITGYKGNGGDVVIPSYIDGYPVTVIDNSAFFCNRVLSSIVFPDTLRVIRKQAFYQCSSLKGDLIIPDSVISIEDSAFELCQGLDGILKLSNNLETLGKRTFNTCSNLKGSLYLPDSLKEIPNACFSSCASLDGTISLPSNLERIDSYAFDRCKSLTGDLFIPDTVTEINSKAFYYCSNLNGILHLPNQLKSISASSFEGCSNFSGDLVIPNSVQSIGSSCFAGTGFAGTLTINAQLKEIPSSAFANCHFQGDLTIPNSVKSIKQDAFLNCKGFTGQLVFPEGIEEIDGFNGCSGFTGELVFPDSVTKIGSFSECTGFTGKLSFPANVTSIGDFIRCTGFTGDLTFPESVTSIGKFSDNNFGPTINLPDSLIYLNYYCFRYCPNIKTVVFPTKPIRIQVQNNRYGPFSESNNLEKLVFPSEEVPLVEAGIQYVVNTAKVIEVAQGSYTKYYDAWHSSIPDRTIKEIGSNTDLIIDGDEVVSYIGTDAVVTIPEGVTKIRDNAFVNNKTLETIFLPQSIKTIENKAFSNCSNLKNIYCTDNENSENTFANFTNLTSIGEYAFNDCGNLTTNPDFPDSLQSLGRFAFLNAGITGELHLPNGITSIPERCFYNCRNISGKLIVPDSLETIESCAFSKCSLTEIVFGKGLKCIEGYGSTLDGTFFDNRITKITFSGDTLPEMKYASYIWLHFGNNITVVMSAKLYGDAITLWGNDILSGVRFDLGTEDEFVIDEDTLILYQGTESTVEIPKNVNKIGAGAFCKNTNIREVIMHDDITYIGDNAFNKTNLTTLSLPKSLTYIGDNAFIQCSNLKGALELPEGLLHIGTGAFSRCTNLSGDLVIPSSVESIGGSAFEYAMNGRLILSSGLKKITPSAFANARFTGPLVIPDTVEEIGEEAFYRCGSLSGELKLPKNLKTMGRRAFYNCSLLEGELVIPDSVSVLNDYLFSGSKISNVIIGTNVNQINMYTFSGCGNLQSVTFTSLDIPSIGDASYSSYMRSLFFSQFPSTCVFYVPSIAYNDYKAAWEKLLNPIDRLKTYSMATLTIVNNLKVDMSNSASVSLSWDEVMDEDITGYNIYRDGVKIADVTETNYKDTGLTPDTEYTYTVTPHIASGEEAKPAEIKATTKLPVVTEVYSDLKDNYVIPANGTLYAKVQNDGNLEGGYGQFYYLDENEEKVTIGTIIETPEDAEDSEENVAIYKGNWKIGDLPSGDYTVRFEFIDQDGGVGQKDGTIHVLNQKPDVITAFEAYGDNDFISLSWSMSHEIDTDTYRIYRKAETEEEFTLLKEIKGRSTVSYDDKSAEEDVKYYYYIVGLSSLGQEGDASAITMAILTRDDEKPQITYLRPDPKEILSGTKIISMGATDNIGVVKVMIDIADGDGEYRLVKMEPASSTTYNLDATKYTSDTIRIRARALDAKGNEGVYEQTYRIDNKGPEKVMGLSTKEVTSTSITLQWMDVADNDRGYFLVEEQQEDGTFAVLEKVDKTLGLGIHFLTPNTSHTYRVVAYDIYGNRGTESDPLTVTTDQDIQAPVVTAMSPAAGSYNHNFVASFTVEDDSAVKSAKIQISRDGIVWETVKTENYSGNEKVEQITYDVDVENLGEGIVYVRAIGKDIVDHEGDDSFFEPTVVPQVKYKIDTIAPSTPIITGADAIPGAIEITWEQGKENDLDGYNLYRSTDGENYQMIASKLESVNYWDEKVEKDIVYSYKLEVKDQAGNVSAMSEAVTAVIPTDTSEPVISAIGPKTGSIIGAGVNEVRIAVTDNWKVQSISGYYRRNDDEEKILFVEKEDINAKTYTLKGNLPVDQFEDGDTIHIYAKAVDIEGNVSEAGDVSYTVDKVAPTVQKVNVDSTETSINISWIGNQEEDLAGYKIYRRSEGTDEYVCIGSREVTETANYTYEDKNVEETASYFYKIEAVDNYGNVSSMESEVIWLNAQKKIFPILETDFLQDVDTEYLYDASKSVSHVGDITQYIFDFGDGSAEASSLDGKAIHRYKKTGTYQVKLTVVASDGSQDTITREVTVSEPELRGVLTVKIEDVDGKPISDIPVYFDLDNTSDQRKSTGSDGRVTFLTPAGQYAVGAYRDGYLPVKRTIITRAGTETEVVLTMVKEPIVTGEFEVNRMTLEEIQAAGIDVKDAANQEFVKFNIKVNYGTAAHDMVVIMNDGEVYAEEKVILKDENGEDDHELIPVVVWSKGRGQHEPVYDATVAILDVPVKASYLKEFFDVKLHILNHADEEFELTQNEVTLNIPSGLSIVPTDSSEQEAKVSFGALSGNSEKTIHWVLRGDRPNAYDLTADYRGYLPAFNEEVKASFKTDKPINVYGLTALALNIDVDSKVTNHTAYFNIGLKNAAGMNMNLPSLDVFEEFNSMYENSGQGSLKPELLRSTLTNASGFETTIPSDKTLSTLAAGETYTKHYAVRNVTAPIDSYIQEVAFDLEKELGIPVKFNLIDMNIEDEEDKNPEMTRPEAPEVSIDFEAEATAESFDETYEYSFDGETYTTCDGTTIPLNPGTVGKYLWIRVKESSSNLTGEVRKLYIPKRLVINASITAKYRGDKIYVNGLIANAVYQLSDSKIEEINDQQFMTPKGMTAEIDADRKYNYLALRFEASDSTFATSVGNIVIEQCRKVSFIDDVDKVDGCQSVSGAGEYFNGDAVTLTAVAKEGYEFVGWYSDGVFRSDLASYRFFIYSDQEYTPVFKCTDNVTVTFIGFNKTAIKSDDYPFDIDTVDKIALPEKVATLNGYMFIGWKIGNTNYTNETVAPAILEKINKKETVSVEAIFERIPESHVVTVENGLLQDGKTTGSYKGSELLIVTANAAPNGYKFAYWEMDGTIVSYKNTYTFYMPTFDTKLKAIYEEEAQVIEPIGTTYMQNITKDIANSKIAFVSIGTVPAGCKIIYSGVVATNNPAKATNGVELTAYNADFVRGSGEGSESHKFTWTKSKVQANETWYVRSYLKYTDSKGNVKELYGDLVTAKLQ